MTEKEIEDIAFAAADQALESLFRALGVDINNQDSINNFRRDLIFAREFRKFSTGAASKVALVVLGAIVAGSIAIFVRGMGLPK